MTDQVIDDLRGELDKVLTALKRELARTRTGRASVSLLEGIYIEYYGAKSPLNQVAGLSAPEPRLLLIQPYDRTALPTIEKAIHQSDLGLTPMNDGKVIRVPIPELTEERRRDLVKHLRRVAEEHKVSIRNHRREAIDMLKALEKDKEITEDDLRRAQEKVQQVTDATIEQVDQILKKKEQEVMEV